MNSPSFERSPLDGDGAVCGGGVVDLARVNSLAEAGYLLHLLTEAGFTASARAGGPPGPGGLDPCVSYLVEVPENECRDAARVLRAEASDDFAAAAATVFCEDCGPADAMNPWRLLAVLAVVALTGAACFLERPGGRFVRPRPNANPTPVKPPPEEPAAGHRLDRELAGCVVARSGLATRTAAFRARRGTRPFWAAGPVAAVATGR